MVISREYFPKCLAIIWEIEIYVNTKHSGLSNVSNDPMPKRSIIKEPDCLPYSMSYKEVWQEVPDVRTLLI